MRAQIVADAVMNAPAYTALYVRPHAEPVVSCSSMRTHVCIFLCICVCVCVCVCVCMYVYV
jgi:hypothetical protein